MPTRIQRKRVKGWKLPPGTACVTRPGPLGNPFTHPDPVYAVAAFRLYARAALFLEPWGWNNAEAAGDVRQVRHLTRGDLPALIRFGELYGRVADPKTWRFDPHPDFPEPLTLVRMPDVEAFAVAFKKLPGKNLACFCEAGAVCHGDVILELMGEG